ncbi:VP1 [Sheep polyomavirus 1]|uniref:VP1 n=1 Tax=Sheep polyomavirus 1 TaxID=1634381 RepID=A0ACD6B8T1_9POLY|nr:VP1 [Sheep polyomavirus 1]AKC98332.1 VP1 [Sheep polyomavirus 1]
MAPKKRSLGQPAPVPKLIVKGGIEVLAVRTGPDSITEIEAYLNPRMGQPQNEDFYGFSDNVTVSDDFGSDAPPWKQFPCYSTARISLPMLNQDMTCDTILMWEAISCRTEVMGVNMLTNVHSAQKRVYENDREGTGIGVEGMGYHMFAIGGEPLELQFMVFNHRATYPAEATVIKNPGASSQVFDPNLKGTLTADGVFPVEAWGPDPFKNENTRYFGQYTGGTQTPPVLTFTNTQTTILLDENGVGPLCKGDGLFLSCADIVGFFTQHNKKMSFRGLPRYFRVTLRKRVVKNPYPVSHLLNTLFSNMQPTVRGQPMQGEDAQVEEVRVYQGVEGLPGDPDMVRFRDQFGQTNTVVGN